MQPFKVSGVWWIPGRDADQVAGTLTFDGKAGIRLALLGAFTDPATPGLQVALVGELRVDKIVGAAEGNFFTLMDCLLLGQRFQAPGIDTQEYHARIVLRGYAPLIDDQFTRCVLRFECLTEWSGVSGFAVTDDARPGQPIAEERTVQVAYRHEPHEVTIESGWKFALQKVVRRHISLHHVDIGSETQIEVTAPIEVTHDEMSRIAVNRFWNLLTFSVGRPCALLEFTLVTQDGRTFEVGSSLVYTNDGDPLALTSHQILLPLHLINFANLVKRWYDLYERASRALNPIFGLLYAPPAYTELQFVVTVMAAEGIHSSVIKNDPAANADTALRRSKILEAIVEHIEDADFQWIEALLRNAGGPTLKLRLLQIWEHTGAAGAWLIPNASNWAKNIKNERNSVSHPSRSKLSALQLYWARESVARMITLTILLELVPEGFEIIDRVSGLADWTFAREQILENLPEWGVTDS